MIKQKSLLIGVGITVILLITLATIKTLSSSSEDTLNVNTNNVVISNFMFTPSQTTVKTGSTITWTNNDDSKHTVTGTWGKSGLFSQDLIYKYTFTKPGTYTYYCEPHPYMKGTVIVTE